MAIATAAVLTAGCGPSSARIVHAPNLAGGQRQLHYRHTGKLFQVANGMQLLILPDVNTNLVKVDVRYRVGAVEDPAGKAGIAHMVEHMSYRVLPNGPQAPSIADRMSLVALYYNAYTTWDETHYTSIAMRDQIAGLLATESARMNAKCDQLPDDVFAHEREVVRNEIRSREGVGAVGYQLLRDAVYGAGHAYHRSIGGTDAEVAGITRQDVCAFLDGHYAPDRAILVVSGNVELAAVTQLVSRLFGPISKQSTQKRTAVAPVRLSGTRSRHELAIEEATALIAFRAVPAMTRGAVRERLLVELLRRRLYSMRIDSRDVTDIAVGIAGGTLAPIVVIAISVKQPARLEVAVDEVLARTGDFLADFDDDALQILRERQRAELMRAVEPFMREASIFADYLQYADHELFLIQDLQELAAIRTPAIKKRAGYLFARAASHVALIYPNEDAVPTEQRAAVTYSSKDYDLQAWREPADPADAERPLVAPSRTIKPVVRSFRLANGLEVLLASMLEYPVVDIRMLYRAGSLHDPDNKPGLARAAAILLESETPLIDNVWQLRQLELVLKMGGEFDQYLDERTTTFRVTGLAMYLDGLLWRLHWMLENGVYRADTLAKWDRLNARGAPSERALATSAQLRALLTTLYGDGHPYARVGGCDDASCKITVGDLERFRARHYRMQGATLIVTGRFDAELAESEIRRLFAWGAGPPAPPVPHVPPAAARDRPHYLAAFDEDKLQTDITIAFDTGPGFVIAHAARLVLVAMLESAMASLRESLGASYGVSVNQIRREGPGLLLVSASVDRDRAGEAFSAMLAALSEIRTGDIRAEFVRARRRVLRRILADTMDSEAVAGELEYIATYRLPRDYYDKLAVEVGKLGLGDVRALVATDLAKRRQVVLARGRRASIEAMYRDAGIGKYRVIRAAPTASK